LKIPIDSPLPPATFDDIWYRTQHPGIADAIRSGMYASAYHHYLAEGARLNWAPNPYFDPDWYACWYLQVDAECAFQHYVTQGVAQGLSPNMYFDEIWYLNNNPDVEKAVKEKQFLSGHQHFLQVGEKEGRRGSLLFDSAWYLERYPDAREYIENGLASGAYDHFCRYGRELGRSGGKASPLLPSAAVQCARRELDDFLSKHKMLELKSSDSPLVSIVVAGNDRPELTLRCLRSIGNWVDVPHEVIVQEMLAGVIGPRVAARAVGKYILYLSSDAELQVGAVQSALEILEREPEVGAVGSKIIGDDGVLLEAGCYLKKNGWPVQFGRGQEPFHFEFMHRRDVPFVSATFLITRRELAPAEPVEQDYFLGLWKRCLRVVFNPESIVIYHDAQASPCSQPALSRNVTTTRRFHGDYLSAVPDYGIGPLSSLDGCRIRKGHLVIVDEIPSSFSSESFYRPELISQMLDQKLFITMYPVASWAGSRHDLTGVVPPEVEVVEGRGVDDLVEFCEHRPGMYDALVLWSDREDLIAAVNSVRSTMRDLRVYAWSPAGGIHTPPP
jgi:hypothetical protein